MTGLDFAPGKLPSERDVHPILKTANLRVSFGGLNAVDGVALEVVPGTIVGLIGPNGAGKTTLLDAVTGFVPISDGVVNFRGQDITGTPPHALVHRGLCRTFQSLELFDDLTVQENLLLYRSNQRWWTSLTDLVRPSSAKPSTLSLSEWALGLFDLGDVRHRMPSELSQGDRRRLAIARALTADPTMLLLDEPGAGLDSHASDRLGVSVARADRARSLGALGRPRHGSRHGHMRPDLRHGLRSHHCSR